MNDLEQKSAEKAPEQPAEAPPQLDPGQFLHTWVMAAMTCTVRGAIASLAGFAPGDVVVMASRVMGQIVGSIFHGELLEVLGRRKQCRDAFLDAIARAPSPQPPPAPNEALTAALQRPKANGKL